MFRLAQRPIARFALRGLLRRPGFTAVAVLALSLGIGATTAVFTLLDGVVLSPLPYENPDQLIQLDHIDVGREEQHELSISRAVCRLSGSCPDALRRGDAFAHGPQSGRGR